MIQSVKNFAERELKGAAYGNLRYFALLEKVEEAAKRLSSPEILDTVLELVYLKECRVYGTSDDKIRKLISRQSFRQLEMFEKSVDEDENMYLTRIAKYSILRIALLAFLQTEAVEAMKRNDFQLAFENYTSIAKLMQNILEES